MNGTDQCIWCHDCPSVIFRPVNSVGINSQRPNIRFAVKRLPTRPHSDEQAAVEMTKTDRSECAVCMEKYKEGDTVKDLPCGHSFHEACIDAWLLGKGRPAPSGPMKLPGLPTCPLCKAVPVDVPEPTLPEKGKPTRQSV